MGTVRNRRSFRKGSAISYVIAGLIPYTEPNLKLTFKPSLFFKELSERSGLAESTLKNALAKAKKENLLNQRLGKVELKAEAKRLIAKFEDSKAVPLDSGYMLVLFDIPQSHDTERRLFVRELKALKFKQIQRSVWASNNDVREIVLDIITELKIGRFVAITLTHPVFGSHYFEK